MDSEATCVILGAGEYAGTRPVLPDHRLLIAADGGLDHAREWGVEADVVVGDFDSIVGPVPPNDDEGDSRTITLPPQKDDTDMLSALKIGWSRGMRTFHIYGGLGGRLDQTLANIQLLALLSSHGGIGFLHGDGTIATAISDGRLTFPAHPCPRTSVVSVLCHGDVAIGVSERGLAYRLDDAIMTNTTPNGISNEFVDASAASVDVLDGTLIVTFPEGSPYPSSVSNNHAMTGGIGALDIAVTNAVNDDPRHDETDGPDSGRRMILYCHRPCSTCAKARAWLDDNGIAFREVEIATNNPGIARLSRWLDQSGLPVRRLFNTSGRQYRARGLSSRLDGLSRDEALSILASDGMLVKRPVLEHPDGVLIGFKPQEWRDALL